MSNPAEAGKNPPLTPDVILAELATATTPDAIRAALPRAKDLVNAQKSTPDVLKKTAGVVDAWIATCDAVIVAKGAEASQAILAGDEAATTNALVAQKEAKQLKAELTQFVEGVRKATPKTIEDFAAEIESEHRGWGMVFTTLVPEIEEYFAQKYALKEGGQPNVEQPAPQAASPDPLADIFAPKPVDATVPRAAAPGATPGSTPDSTRPGPAVQIENARAKAPLKKPAELVAQSHEGLTAQIGRATELFRTKENSLVKDWLAKADIKTIPNTMKLLNVLHHASAGATFEPAMLRELQAIALFAAQYGADKGFTPDKLVAAFDGKNDPIVKEKAKKLLDQLTAGSPQATLDAKVFKKWFDHHAKSFQYVFFREPAPASAPAAPDRTDDTKPKRPDAAPSGTAQQPPSPAAAQQPAPSAAPQPPRPDAAQAAPAPAPAAPEAPSTAEVGTEDKKRAAWEFFATKPEDVKDVSNSLMKMGVDALAIMTTKKVKRGLDAGTKGWVLSALKRGDQKDLDIVFKYIEMMKAK